MSRYKGILFLLIFFCGGAHTQGAHARAAYAQHAHAQDTSDDLDLHERMQPVDTGCILQLPGDYVWGSSVIKGEDDRYYRFYSRWPHGKRPAEAGDSLNYIFDGFSGWLKYSEIAYAVSDKLMGPYHPMSTVLKGSGDAASWDRYTMHNPQIRKFKGRYYLYYVSNFLNKDYRLEGASPKWLHWMQYNSGQRIGVLEAATIQDLVNGKGRRSLVPLMAPDDKQTFEIAVNPSVTEGPDGLYYMMFKSRRPHVGSMTSWIARAATPTGPFQLMGPVFTDKGMAFEDPCMWYDKTRKRFYAAVKYYSNSGILAPQTGALALISSEDGIKWHAAAHPLISLRELRLRGGKTLPLSNLERPFIVTDDKGRPLALFAAARKQGEDNTFNVGVSFLPLQTHQYEK